jgi:hypothetical protein
MKHPQDHNGIRYYTVSGNVRRTANHKFPRIGSPACPPHPRLICQSINRLPDTLRNALRCLWVIFSNMGTDMLQILAGTTMPCDPHAGGSVSRSVPQLSNHLATSS